MSTRALIASIVAGIVILGAIAGYLTVQPRGLLDPEVQIQNEDYVQTRTHFRTKLLREADSPQREVVFDQQDSRELQVRSPLAYVRSVIADPALLQL